MKSWGEHYEERVRKALEDIRAEMPSRVKKLRIVGHYRSEGPDNVPAYNIRICSTDGWQYPVSFLDMEKTIGDDIVLARTLQAVEEIFEAQYHKLHGEYPDEDEFNEHWKDPA